MPLKILFFLQRENFLRVGKRQTQARAKGKNKQETRKRKVSAKAMKLWKSKKSATTSCVSAVSGKLNLSGNKNGYKDEDQTETISAATATNQSTIHMANGLHQGEALHKLTHCLKPTINLLEAFPLKIFFSDIR